jgi:hypothetical protein
MDPVKRIPIAPKYNSASVSISFPLSFLFFIFPQLTFASGSLSYQAFWSYVARGVDFLEIPQLLLESHACNLYYIFLKYFLFKNILK